MSPLYIHIHTFNVNMHCFMLLNTCTLAYLQHATLTTVLIGICYIEIYSLFQMESTQNFEVPGDLIFAVLVGPELSSETSKFEGQNTCLA